MQCYLCSAPIYQETEKEHPWLSKVIALLPREIEPYYMPGKLYSDGRVYNKEGTHHAELGSGKKDPKAVHQACWKIFNQPLYDTLYKNSRAKRNNELDAFWKGEDFYFDEVRKAGYDKFLEEPKPRNSNWHRIVRFNSSFYQEGTGKKYKVGPVSTKKWKEICNTQERTESHRHENIHQLQHIANRMDIGDQIHSDDTKERICQVIKRHMRKMAQDPYDFDDIESLRQRELKKQLLKKNKVQVMNWQKFQKAMVGVDPEIVSEQWVKYKRRHGMI